MANPEQLEYLQDSADDKCMALRLSQMQDEGLVADEHAHCGQSHYRFQRLCLGKVEQVLSQILLTTNY